ncbi:MAG: hypothetical protein V9E90_03200 [Saprospiraceae bacterium]
MKQRIYIDTSVFGGYFDPEFDMFTRPLFDRIFAEEMILLFSATTQEELFDAPEEVKNLVQKVKTRSTEYLDLNLDIIQLANDYIAHRVVGKTSFADCLHIATASFYHADYLVSWNFKHIVNVNRIIGYNSINIRNGYKPLEIRSPREFINYGNEE